VSTKPHCPALPRPARRPVRAQSVVTEAQELPDAKVADAAAPLPVPDLPIVGDRAHARHGSSESCLNGSIDRARTGYNLASK